MVVSQPAPAVDLSGRALLLGLPGDVDLHDYRGVTAGVVAERIAASRGHVPVGVQVSDPAVIPTAVAAGAALVHLPSGAGWATEVRSAAAGGVVVVLTGDHWVTVGVALDLVRHAARPENVVVELAVTSSAGTVDVKSIGRYQAAGLSVGVELLAEPGPAVEATGWEVGMLTHLLDLGVRTVRNVRQVRLRRVQAVVDAVAQARQGDR